MSCIQNMWIYYSMWGSIAEFDEGELLVLIVSSRVHEKDVFHAYEIKKCVSIDQQICSILISAFPTLSLFSEKNKQFCLFFHLKTDQLLNFSEILTCLKNVAFVISKNYYINGLSPKGLELLFKFQ